MQKVLIISYFFPPNNLVGAERPFSWYKYFHKFGFYPIVVTRHWNHKVNHISEASLTDNSPLKIEKNELGEVHYLPYRGTLRDRVITKFGTDKFVLLRKLLTLIELFTEYVSLQFSAYKFLYDYTIKIIEDEKPVIILISANPFTQFRIGYLIKKSFGIPWVADYRDDWTTNELNERAGVVKKILLPIERYFEKKWLQSASHFFSVTPVYTKRIEKLTGISGTTIYNGFELTNHENSLIKKEMFTLLYIGSVYAQQNFMILGQAIELLILNKKILAEQIEVCFIGSTMNSLLPKNVEELSIYLKKTGVKCKILPHASGADFAKAVSLSSMLFFSRYGNLQGIVPAKIFTYLGSLKPILLVESDTDTIEYLLKPYSLGFIANSKEEAAKAIQFIIDNPGIQPTDEDRHYINNFSRYKQASLVAEKLHQLIAK